MLRDKPVKLSLTARDSHCVKIQSGQGSFSFGPAKHRHAKKFDAIVQPDVPINWAVFEQFAGWPRYFDYTGNDAGFIQWSVKREIENITWEPCSSQQLDCSGANIYHFFLELGDNIELTLSNLSVHHLCVRGQLSNLALHDKQSNVECLSFQPDCSKNAKSEPYQLPVLPSLAQVESINIHVDPMGQAFDCASLLQFENLTDITLSGNLTNFAALTKLDLRNLAIRYCPNLTDFPSLDSWAELNQLIIWNAEETNGKRLRSELNKLKKVKELEHASVSKLRKKDWFVTEYGLPFSAWTKGNERIANKAYKSAVKEIAVAINEQEIKAAIYKLVDAVNQLDDIETPHRDDMSLAIDNLADVCPIDIDHHKFNQWFDDKREF